MIIALSLLFGFILDFIFSEWTLFTHPIVLIGRLISSTETFLRKRFVRKPNDEYLAGLLLVLFVIAVSSAFAYLFVRIFSFFGLFGRLLCGSYFAFRVISPRCLYDESIKVYYKLARGDIEGARHALSMIVGRDTQYLTYEGIAKACIETIAENTADGVGAPLFYFAVLGPIGAFVYKAINTMDSMIGYKNERYQRLGYCAAKLDDIVNFLPSRITAIVMILASRILKLDYRSAFRIFIRDRLNHSSPNSAQTESVAAGALGLMLGGSSYYSGELYEKPTIGDYIKDPSNDLIMDTEKLMYLTSLLCCLLFMALSLLLGNYGI